MGIELEEWPEDVKNNQKPERRCKNCRHFCPYVYEYDDDVDSDLMLSDYGECRRFPPKAVPSEESGFPIVEETMWCGEFDI